MRRIDELAGGHRVWSEDRKAARNFPGGPYILLHALAHLLIQSVAMRCGYPASSIRERIYSDADSGRYGLLLYTASPDAEGTPGGLVAQARHIEEHLAAALSAGGLRSNDPVRTALAGGGHGAPLAARSRVPRLRARRRDLVRDEEFQKQRPLLRSGPDLFRAENRDHRPSAVSREFGDISGR